MSCLLSIYRTLVLSRITGHTTAKMWSYKFLDNWSLLWSNIYSSKWEIVASIITTSKTKLVTFHYQRVDPLPAPNLMPSNRLLDWLMGVNISPNFKPVYLGHRKRCSVLVTLQIIIPFSWSIFLAYFPLRIVDIVQKLLCDLVSDEIFFALKPLSNRAYVIRHSLLDR